MVVDIYEEKVCPKCRLTTSMNYYLKKEGEIFVCQNDPTHKFKIGKSGYLEEVK